MTLWWAGSFEHFSATKDKLAKPWVFPLCLKTAANSRQWAKSVFCRVSFFLLRRSRTQSHPERNLRRRKRTKLTRSRRLSKSNWPKTHNWKSQRQTKGGDLPCLSPYQVLSSSVVSNTYGKLSTTSHFCLSGSILGNAQSAELRTYLAGQIARALAVFSVDEVIVFDDEGKLKLDDIVEHTVKTFSLHWFKQGGQARIGVRDEVAKRNERKWRFPDEGSPL